MVEAGHTPRDNVEIGVDWRQLAEALPHIVWVTRPDGYHVYFNQQWFTFTGRTLEQSVGDGWNPAFHPDDRARAAMRWQEATSTGEPYEIEYRLRRHDGAYRWMLGRAMPLCDAEGTIVRWFGTCTDITDLKAATERAEQLAAQLADTFESISDPLFTLDHQLRFKYVNSRAADLFGASPAALAGQSLFSWWPQFEDDDFGNALRRALTDRAGKTLHDVSLTRPPIITEVHIYPSVSGLTLTLKDVTEHRRAETALRERVKELGAAANINSAVQRIDDAEVLADTVADALRAGMSYPDETRVEVVLGEFVAVAGNTPSDAVTLVEPIGRPDQAHGSLRLLFPPQGFLDEERVLVANVASTLALWHERRTSAADLSRANDQLAEANRFKDDLLSMASHELRTPLTPILGLAETLRTREASLTKKQQEMVAGIHRNATRMSHLVYDLLTVNRADAGVLVSRPEPVVVESIMSAVVDDLRDIVGGVKCPDGQTVVTADPEQLSQMLINLLTNAAKYGAPPIEAAVEAIDCRMVRVTVRDHGPGVNDEFAEQMWQRFTQKDRGDRRTASGAGLGLPIVKLLAELNGGQVRYVPAHPGAQFELDLPAA